MTLSRASVTTASRVMLPTYVCFFALLGLNYTVTGQRLFASPALAYADSILPLPAWGCMFLAAAVMMAAALVQQERSWFRFALWLGIVCLGIWAVVFLAAAIRSDASPGGALWPALAAVACFASDRSLLKGEV